MKPSKYQTKRKQQLKYKAFLLYKQGLSTRQVGKAIGKSHAWVALAVKELSPE